MIGNDRSGELKPLNFSEPNGSGGSRASLPTEQRKGEKEISTLDTNPTNAIQQL
jgi:hypothetical protein